MAWPGGPRDMASTKRKKTKISVLFLWFCPQTFYHHAMCETNKQKKSRFICSTPGRGFNYPEIIQPQAPGAAGNHNRDTPLHTEQVRETGGEGGRGKQRGEEQTFPGYLSANRTLCPARTQEPRYSKCLLSWDLPQTPPLQPHPNSYLVYINLFLLRRREQHISLHNASLSHTLYVAACKCYQPLKRVAPQQHHTSATTGSATSPRPLSCRLHGRRQDTGGAKAPDTAMSMYSCTLS
ncbi:hypothetical protein L209DRAFT_416477 [Thermothelomyces heterothallicus CBS 203.75]